ncbi:MAG: two-component sensor histidine kinase [Alphaproteobacteria bacterium]|nr:two-component sensor histidine kinase [Alphaproteobacteria bacterium]
MSTNRDRTPKSAKPARSPAARQTAKPKAKKPSPKKSVSKAIIEPQPSPTGTDAPAKSAPPLDIAAPSKAPATLPVSLAALPHDQLLNALPHPVIVLGPQNTFVYANAAAEAFLSTSLAMLRRIRLDDILAFGCPLVALVEQVRRKRATVNEYGIEVVTPRISGSKIVDVYSGPFADKNDQVVLMLQQRSMAQMIERQLTHRAAARSVSGMAGVLAHEIKNPLSGIRGAAQLLETNLSDEDRVLSQLICNETDRIRALLDRMEVFGDERPLKKDPVNIHDVLDHVRQLAIAGFARNIAVVADYDPSLPPVPANRDKLVQAFLNLVKNAAEAIGPDADNGRIVITTAFRPGVRISVPGSGTRISLPLMIEIQDNGPGVPDAIREHMFDPFVTSKTNGTGLGLALVAKLIADHGGTIECDSGSNKTVFRILLPMQEAPQVQPGGHSKTTREQPTRT